MEAKKEKFMERCNRQLLLVGNIKRSLSATKSMSTSIESNQDLDHLLEEPEQESERQFKARKKKSLKKKPLLKDVTDSKSMDAGQSWSPTQEPNNETLSQSTPNTPQIPSSMIVLTEQEKAELKDVLMQITLRECGL